MLTFQSVLVFLLVTIALCTAVTLFANGLSLGDTADGSLRFVGGLLSGFAGSIAAQNFYWPRRYRGE